MPTLAPPQCPRLVVDLAHRRWTIPLLAELHEAARPKDPTGARLAGLVHRLDAGRESVRQTLDFAIAHGWVVRNSGHGHPLRPEFVLTSAGIPIAGACAEVCRAAAAVGGQEAIARKWALPVLRVLQPGPARFGEVKEALADHGVTDRALSLTLRGLHGRGFVRRELVRSRPTGVRYQLGAKGRAIAAAATAL